MQSINPVYRSQAYGYLAVVVYLPGEHLLQHRTSCAVRKLRNWVVTNLQTGAHYVAKHTHTYAHPNTHPHTHTHTKTKLHVHPPPPAPVPTYTHTHTQRYKTKLHRCTTENVCSNIVSNDRQTQYKIATWIVVQFSQGHCVPEENVL